MSATFPAYPDEGEVFELTLDGDDPDNDPLAMASEHNCITGWRYTGAKFMGTQTGRFMLVLAGYCSSIKQVQARLTKPGQTIPEGQWRQAFRAKFPRHDGGSVVGVADDSWQDLAGSTRIPCVRGYGENNFPVYHGWVHGGFRWLVRVG